ncbi:MAG: type II toxin-antitoxin system death-on-curing family toxin [Bryobacteraceae bacterium]|nr:type II toxin-antitoxin system death-on-curing family toxin [Bryobacteraceae bacterium]
MKICRFLTKREVLAFHLEQIREHGGATGIRDEGLLESALARPENLAAYGEPDLFDLAASYSFGLARHHPFVDGNKRTAFMAAYTFLGLNGQRLIAPEPDAALTFWRLAAGELSESELAAWFRLNSEPR